MDTLIGKICPFCQNAIEEGDSVIICPSCNIPHHENCWYNNGGCTTPECSYYPQNISGEQPSGGFDLSDQLDFSDGGISEVGKNSDSPKGLNRAITIMSFMENRIDEESMEYSKQRDEKIKLGKESLKVMSFTKETSANKSQPNNNSSNQNAAKLTKPQQSQHKASLTKPNNNRNSNSNANQSAQKQDRSTIGTTGGAGTKANLSKSQLGQQTKASLTKPGASAKPSLQKTTSSAKPTLSKGDKPRPDSKSGGNPASVNKINSAVNNKSNRTTTNEKFEVLCVQCKKLIPSDRQFCPFCGAVQKEKEKPQYQRRVACPNCGGLVRADQVFCPRCGRQIDENLTLRAASPTELVPSEEVDKSVSTAVTQLSDALEKSRKKRNKRLVFTGAATILLVAAVLITLKATEKKNFSSMFWELEKNSWCEISADGMSMDIDTNPEDKPDNIESMAYSQIKEINKTLGFKENIYRSMGNTRAVDGERFATFKNYKVTWAYNPDTGLEVHYTMQ